MKQFIFFLTILFFVSCYRKNDLKALRNQIRVKVMNCIIETSTSSEKLKELAQDKLDGNKKVIFSKAGLDETDLNIVKQCRKTMFKNVMEEERQRMRNAIKEKSFRNGGESP